MTYSADFGARQTRVSGGAAIYKLNALEQISLPNYSFVSLSATWTNRDIYLTELLWEQNETRHVKSLAIPCIGSE